MQAGAHCEAEDSAATAAVPADLGGRGKMWEADYPHWCEALSAQQTTRTHHGLTPGTCSYQAGMVADPCRSGEPATDYDAAGEGAGCAAEKPGTEAASCIEASACSRWARMIEAWIPEVNWSMGAGKDGFEDPSRGGVRV